jgi:chitodextrinase
MNQKPIVIFFVAIILLSPIFISAASSTTSVTSAPNPSLASLYDSLNSIIRNLTHFIQNIALLGKAEVAKASSPSSEPLLYPSNLQYVGAFRLPNYHENLMGTSFGGTALAFNPADNGLFMVGYGDNGKQPIAEFSIPSTIVNSSNLNNLTTDTVIQRWVDVLPNLPNKLTGISDGAPIGGLMVYNNQIIGTRYAYYSGATSQVLSHFVLSSTNLSTAVASGLYQVGSGGRALAGYMCPIPNDWQSSLGGYTALTGLSDKPIISTESSGPASFGFNPEQLGGSNTTNVPMVYYPSSHELGNYYGPADPMQNGGTAIEGVVFVPTTSSVLYFGSASTSYTGYGNSGPWGDNVHGGKGPHALNGKYAFQVWAYNANDLVSVYQGKLQSWQLKPYSVWNISLPIPGSYTPGGVAFDPSTQRIYFSILDADKQAPQSDLPLIEVFQLNLPSGANQDTSPAIGVLTGAPSVTPVPGAVDSTGAQVPLSTGTYAGPVNPGDPIIFTAGNVYPVGNKSITSVKFYLDTNNDGTLETASDQLIGAGAPDTINPNATQNYTVTLQTSQLSQGSYTVFAQAQDSSGLLSSSVASSFTIATPSLADTTPPSVPTNLTATAISSSQINLSWTASTDNVAVTGYKVFRAGVQIGASAIASYTDIGLTTSTAYSYTVLAYDAAGNNSAQSASASATTQAPAVVADLTPPSVPTNLTATAISSSQINLSWTASTDNVAVTGYKVFQGNTLLATIAGTSYQNLALTPSTSYTYTVSAIDGAGNVSVLSSSATATTQSLSATVPSSSVSGCNDPTATNYNPAATQNDGSCIPSSNSNSNPNTPLSVTAPPLTFTTTTLPDATVNQPYSKDINFTYSGNTAPLIIFTSSSSDLELSTVNTYGYNNVVTLQFTPRKAGHYTITANAQVNFAVTAGTATFNLNVNEPSTTLSTTQTPSTTTPPSTTGTINVPPASAASLVKRLQILLNQTGFTVAQSGPGSSGNETDYFGPRTAAAECKLQVANGLSVTNPYCGKLPGHWTKAIIFEKYGVGL